VTVNIQPVFALLSVLPLTASTEEGKKTLLKGWETFLQNLYKKAGRPL